MKRTRAKPGKQQDGAAINVSGVGILRERRWILRDIDWQVRPGELAAVLGPNGSGKSTLAHIIAAHLWPTAGQAALLGQSFGQTNLPELRKRIKLVQPAGPYEVDPDLSVTDVVLTGFFGSLNLYDHPTPKMQREAHRLLKRVGLAHVRHQPYRTLSSGERMRSLIARALAAGPELLILDEPTAGLDLPGREQVLATIQALAGQLTIVLITHHVEELPPATDRVLLLQSGRAAAWGPKNRVLKSRILSDVYGVRVSVRLVGERYYTLVHPGLTHSSRRGQ